MESSEDFLSFLALCKLFRHDHEFERSVIVLPLAYYLYLMLLNLVLLADHISDTVS